MYDSKETGYVIPSKIVGELGYTGTDSVSILMRDCEGGYETITTVKKGLYKRRKDNTVYLYFSSLKTQEGYSPYYSGILEMDNSVDIKKVYPNYIILTTFEEATKLIKDHYEEHRNDKRVLCPEQLVGDGDGEATFDDFNADDEYFDVDDDEDFDADDEYFDADDEYIRRIITHFVK